MSLNHWILATRPKTLPAGAMPVVIASSLSFFEGYFDFLTIILALICSVFIQILTNFINEIYDFKKGADGKDRLGPQRQVAAGNISYKTMIIASSILAICTFLIGLVLVKIGGWQILVIGLTSLLCAYLYTGGPYPLAYKGLGDIFVLIFFGIVAVGGTYFILSHTFNFNVFIAGIAPGLLSVNILGVNNIRDIETDKLVNKMTMQVRLGKKGSIIFYKINLLLTYVSILYLAFSYRNPLLLITFFTLLIVAKHQKMIVEFSGEQYNILLAESGKLLIIFGLLESIAFIAGKYV